MAAKLYGVVPAKLRIDGKTYDRGQQVEFDEGDPHIVSVLRFGQLVDLKAIDAGPPPAPRAKRKPAKPSAKETAKATTGK